ncbi:hypothetical protein O7630_33450 [Micromonospora sp. WMMD718]|nr:hypothetical protein [Micromonospora sp. WMMD718]MDG4755853.1 hypothetical protein [Micromonospora sp. WMMD718]
MTELTSHKELIAVLDEMRRGLGLFEVFAFWCCCSACCWRRL